MATSEIVLQEFDENLTPELNRDRIRIRLESNEVLIGFNSSRYHQDVELHTLMSLLRSEFSHQVFIGIFLSLVPISLVQESVPCFLGSFWPHFRKIHSERKNDKFNEILEKLAIERFISFPIRKARRTSERERERELFFVPQLRIYVCWAFCRDNSRFFEAFQVQKFTLLHTCTHTHPC